MEYDVDWTSWGSGCGGDLPEEVDVEYDMEWTPLKG